MTLPDDTKRELADAPPVLEYCTLADDSTGSHIWVATVYVDSSLGCRACYALKADWDAAFGA